MPWLTFWPKQTYPTRAASHGNSAFVTVLGMDCAAARGDRALAALLQDQALAWYGNDRNQPAREPGGNEFLAPALLEALAMQRAIGARLPELVRRLSATPGRSRTGAVVEPAIVADRSDGKLAHLDGLNLSQAWCWHELAAALPAADERRPLCRKRLPAIPKPDSPT